MSSLRRLFLRLYTFLRAGRAEDELGRELASHLRLLDDEFQRRGMTPEEARLAAMRKFGGIEQAKERQRDERSFAWLEDARRDVRYAARTLAKTPGFTAVAVITLALGIGAASTIFSVVHGVLLRPLPYKDSDRLVRIVESLPASAASPGAPSRRASMDANEFVEWRRRAQTLSNVAAYVQPPTTILATSEGVERLTGGTAAVSPALFAALGVQPTLGRVLDSGDERAGASVAVISAMAWQRYFHSDPAVLHKTVVLDGRGYSVVGVMPAGFDFPTPQIEFWTPYVVPPAQGGRRTSVSVIAQLREGVSLDAATAEANALGPELRGSGDGPGSGNGQRFAIGRVKDLMVAPVRPAMDVLIVAVGIVLLVVCANVANLLLARTASRQREIATRRALGASRGRLIRQMLTESLGLSFVGGAAGVAVAYGGVQLVKTLATVNTPEIFQLAERARFAGSHVLPRLQEIAVDTRMLFFALGITMITGALVGIVPVLHLSSRAARPRSLPIGAASLGSRVSPGGRLRLRDLLVIGQLILATVLLIAAVLLIRSFLKLSNVDVGYDRTHVLTFQLVLPEEFAAAHKVTLADEFAARLRSVPHVEAVGYTNGPPLLGAGFIYGIFVPPGHTLEEMLRDTSQNPQARSISSGYLRALGVRLLEGRWLDEHDGAGGLRVMLVNQTVVRRFFGGKSPLGQNVRMQQGPIPSPPWEIVGVVNDVRYGMLDEDPEPMVFMDSRQVLASAQSRKGPGPPPAGMALGLLSYAVRVQGDPVGVSSDIRALVRQLDSAAGLASVATMRQLVSGSLVRPRFYAALLGSFGAIAGVLAVIGIYGVLAYSIIQRTHELGVRMALGAQASQVLRMVLSKAIVLTSIGIGIGTVGAVFVSRYLDGMLFGLSATNPSTYAFVAAVFATVAMVASYLPARRATKVDPLLVLRCE